MIGNCTRCGKNGFQVVPIFVARPGGHTPLSSVAEIISDKAESACADCISDGELAQMLHPVAEFVLSTVPRNDQNGALLDAVQAIFSVRNNNDRSTRHDALRAAGLLE